MASTEVLVPESFADLRPAVLWDYFLRLSAIPRGSKRESAAARWVADQGRALGCDVAQDAVGNVRIRKPGTPGREAHAMVALQAHVDMVCEKNEDTVHDFERDPIRVRRDGDWLRATGTTLGADNGIGVATALAVLATPGLAHPPLEILVTVDEETGLTGANNVAPGWLRSAILLNLDSEDEGELTIGCAGGIDTIATRAIRWERAPADTVARRVKVSGLKGGHSGVDIGMHRCNAIRVLADALCALLPAHGLALGAVAGGNKRNAIAREASAVVHVPRDRLGALEADVARLAAEVRTAVGAHDPGVQLALVASDEVRALSADDGRALLGLLLAGPHGVEAMSPDIAGLVQTSTNLGIVACADDAAQVTFLTRSSIDASKRALADRIAMIASVCGFTAATENDYPGWRPVPDAEIVRTIQRVHQEVVGAPVRISAIHAGLECGIIGERCPGLQMASIGPTMRDVHTPDERVAIGSVERFWGLLVAVLAAV